MSPDEYRFLAIALKSHPLRLCFHSTASSNQIKDGNLEEEHRLIVMLMMAVDFQEEKSQPIFFQAADFRIALLLSSGAGAPPYPCAKLPRCDEVVFILQWWHRPCMHPPKACFCRLFALSHIRPKTNRLFHPGEEISIVTTFAD